MIVVSFNGTKIAKKLNNLNTKMPIILPPIAKNATKIYYFFEPGQNAGKQVEVKSY